jgi:hypothetical protein
MVINLKLLEKVLSKEINLKMKQINPKILLLNPNWRDLEKVGRMSKMTSGVPLELIYIAGSLKKLKIGFEIIDLWGLDKNLQDYKDKILNANIVVVNTAPSYVYWRDGTIDCELPKKIIQDVKNINPAIKTIVIGPHGTVLPESIASRDVDYIIRGEPDIITAKLIEAIIRGEKTDLAGVCQWQGAKFYISKEYAIVKNLDALEAPYELLNLKNYSIPEHPEKNNKKSGKIITTYYEASRGCPFNCIFCLREGFRGKLRFKSIKKIDGELKRLKKIGVKYIFFIDECFGFDSPWFRKVLKILKKEGIEWACQSRPHLWNKNRLAEAAKSGCVSIEFGVESVNKKILGTLKKGSTDIDKLRENINSMISLGICPGLSFIIGSPYETKDTIREMRNYLLQFPIEKIRLGCHVMLPYPKTELWNLGLKDGLPLKSWPDVKKYAGIIHNDFTNSEAVNLEVKRFLSFLRIRKAKSRINKNIGNFAFMELVKNVGILTGSIIIVAVPRTASMLEKTINLFRTGKFVTNDYL